MSAQPSKPSQARRGAKALLGGSAIAQVCALARYALLARLLGPEQLGLAAILILTAQFFDSISDSGGDRFLVQDKDGDEPKVQNLVQMVFVGRGVLIALVLICCSSLLAQFYGAPQIAMGFVILAAAPLLGGFAHMDLRRVQRHSDFRPESVAMVVSEVMALIVTGVAAWITRDFTATLYGLIVRSAALTLVSHVMAKRPYRLGFDREHSGRLAKFAAPLVLNGLLLFLCSQGDRVIIGNQLGPAALGHYSAVLLLIFYPVSMISRFLVTIYLPQLSSAHLNEVHKILADRIAGQLVLLSIVIAVGFVSVAPLATEILFGAEFNQPPFLFALIGGVQTLRLARHWPTVIALGEGRSHIILISNIVRLVGFPAAIAGLLTIGGLPGIVLGFTLGELLSLIIGVAMSNHARGRPILWQFDRIVLLVVVLFAALVATMVAEDPGPLKLTLLGAAVLAIATWTLVREATTVREAIALAAKVGARFKSKKLSL